MEVKVGNSKGFTLVEVIVVAAIIGILASIAYPSYIKYKIRTSRTVAQNEMMAAAQKMQTYKSVNGSFSGATLANIYGVTADTDNGIKIPRQGVALYKLYYVDSDDTVLASTTGNGWTLKAIPISTAQQKNDGVICLNDQMQKYWSSSGTTCKNILSNSSSWDK